MPHDEAPTGEIILYQTEDGRTRLECRFVDETLWLSQALMGELFQKDVRTINEHLRNIYDEGELDPEATIRKFRIVREEGSRKVARDIEHYSLEAILAVGYRVRSPRGTQFRVWATEHLREYLIKGFTMDDERLKTAPVEGSGVPDYFDELLERIRDIRASERRMYLRVPEPDHRRRGGAERSRALFSVCRAEKSRGAFGSRSSQPVNRQRQPCGPRATGNTERGTR